MADDTEYPVNERAGDGRGLQPRADEHPPLVLVAISDPATHSVCAHALRAGGYRVQEANDGDSLVASTHGQKPDVVVLDARLNGEGGIDSARRLKHHPETADIPIIMLTADIQAAIDSGVDEFAAKPLQERDLLARVAAMIRLSGRLRDLSRTCRRLGEQTRMLCLLFDYTSAVVTDEELVSLLARTAHTAAELATARRVSILLTTPNRDSLECAYALGPDSETADRYSVPIADGLVGRVLTTGDLVMINEDASRLSDTDEAMVGHPPILLMPLGGSGRAIGVLTLSGRAGRRPFDDSDAQTLSMLANIAGTAIHSKLRQEARDAARDSIMVALAKLAEYRDNATGAHLERVVRYSTILAEELATTDSHRARINQEFIRQLQQAAPLHDIGKVAVPDRILLKPGPLSEDEFALIQRHAVIGADIIQTAIRRIASPSFLAMAEQIARSHHEWYDGRGYPSNLKGELIPLAARIVAVADVYDALTTRRSYKSSYSHDEAVEILRRQAGTHFDPLIIDAFLKRERDFASLAQRLSDESVLPSPELHLHAVGTTPLPTAIH